MTHGNPQQTALAYCAGLIDGEGTIRINCGGVVGGRTSPMYQAQISCGMTTREGIEALIALFGGKMRTERVPGKRLVYRWSLTGNRICRNAIWSLYPYLKVKKRQAAVVLDFIFNFVTHGYERNKGVPAQELRRREDLYQVVRKLNARGVAATTESENSREAEATV